jgi:hypothetical protein
MRPSLTRPAALLLVLFALAATACSSPKRDPISVDDEGVLSVENQTGSDWHDVVVTVNDYFNAGGKTLAAGGRLTAPLTQFKTAFGQPYDRTRQSVYKVEVKATDATGAIVHLQWNGDRKPR